MMSKVLWKIFNHLPKNFPNNLAMNTIMMKNYLCRQKNHHANLTLLQNKNKTKNAHVLLIYLL